MSLSLHVQSLLTSLILQCANILPSVIHNNRSQTNCMYTTYIISAFYAIGPSNTSPDIYGSNTMQLSTDALLSEWRVTVRFNSWQICLQTVTAAVRYTARWQARGHCSFDSGHHSVCSNVKHVNAVTIYVQSHAHTHTHTPRRARRSTILLFVTHSTVHITSTIWCHLLRSPQLTTIRTR